MIHKILRLGDGALYQPSAEIQPDELRSLRSLAEDLFDTLADYRRRHGHGNMITAPQIGVAKRMCYLNLEEECADTSHVYILNPIILFPSTEIFEMMDTCASYPWLRVKARRYRQCTLRYRNLDWQEREVLLQDGLAALVQHGVDHLDGILGTQRAVDDKSLFARQE